jgi:hypothetical protein
MWRLLLLSLLSLGTAAVAMPAWALAISQVPATCHDECRVAEKKFVSDCSSPPEGDLLDIAEWKSAKDCQSEWDNDKNLLCLETCYFRLHPELPVPCSGSMDCVNPARPKN